MEHNTYNQFLSNGEQFSCSIVQLSVGLRKSLTLWHNLTVHLKNELLQKFLSLPHIVSGSIYIH